jgi:CRP-like cAMP-binding protein
MTRSALTRNKHDLALEALLGAAGQGRKVVTFLKQQTIFSQGDAAGAVFYLQKGKVRHTVVSRFGKEAVLGISSEGEFFGEGGLAGQPSRMGSATAITDCKLLQIDQKAMMLALRTEHAFYELFLAYLLARNIRYHEALVDQLFDSSEMRLAQVLLRLVHFGMVDATELVVPKVSQETLARMAGITRMRVRSFMSGFKESGFVAYGKSGLQIHSSLLSVILHN